MLCHVLDVAIHFRLRIPRGSDEGEDVETLAEHMLASWIRLPTNRFFTLLLITVKKRAVSPSLSCYNVSVTEISVPGGTRTRTNRIMSANWSQGVEVSSIKQHRWCRPRGASRLERGSGFAFSPALERWSKQNNTIAAYEVSKATFGLKNKSWKLVKLSWSKLGSKGLMPWKRRSQKGVDLSLDLR